MNIVTKMGMVVGLMGMAAVGSPRAQAQSEIDPDHFELANTTPFDQPKADVSKQARAVRYGGEFTLPYSVECNGKAVSPGKYSLSFRLETNIVQLTLNRKGQLIKIAGNVRKQASNDGHSALIIDHTGKTRQISMFHIAQLDFVVDSNPKLEQTSGGKTRLIERLPIFLAAARER
jgi:hypothetical protein